MSVFMGRPEPGSVLMFITLFLPKAMGLSRVWAATWSPAPVIQPCWSEWPELSHMSPMAMVTSGPKLFLIVMTGFLAPLHLRSVLRSIAVLFYGPCEPYVKPCVEEGGPLWVGTCTSRRAGSHIWERQSYISPPAWESWFHSSPEGSDPSDPD